MPFLLLLFLFLPGLAQGAGIQVTPAKLELTTTTNTAVSTEIVVANPTADVQIFEVYADDFRQVFNIDPKSFVLESGVRKTVAIEIGPRAKPEIITTTLSVVAKPLAEARFQASSGAKILVTVTINEGENPPSKINLHYLQAAMLIAIIAIGYYLTHINKTLRQ